MRDPESVPPQERMRSEMRQWNVATGELNWSIPASGAFALAGSPDDRWLATVEGYEIQLRDPGTGQVTRKWAIDKRLLALTFSPDGKTLAAGISEWKQPTKGGVQTWDIEDGTLKNSWSEEDVTRFVRYSPDGRYLAGSSNSVKVWDAETGKLVRILPTGGKFGFSPDSKHIAAMVPHGDEPSQAGKRYDVRIATVDSLLDCSLDEGEHELDGIDTSFVLRRLNTSMVDDCRFPEKQQERWFSMPGSPDPPDFLPRFHSPSQAREESAEVAFHTEELPGPFLFPIGSR